MLRADFHHHIDTDPVDGSFVRHSAGELVDRAVATGLNVLAITCHESIPYDEDITQYAADRGVCLLRGMEATVDGHHVLLLNFPEWPAGECSMEEVQALKTRDALVISPHPFYPARIAGAQTLKAYRGVFDAVEFSGMYTPLTKRFNQRALDYARTTALPVVGNTDTHFLWQVGHTYTEIDAVPNVHGVIEAVRHGRVRLVTRPLSWIDLARFVVESHSTKSILRDSLGYMMQVLQRTKRPGRYTAPQSSIPSSLRAG